MTTPEHILLTGATGKTGGRVASKLTERGIRVRAGSRSASPPFDWEDRATWAPALAGVDAAYVAFAPDVAMPGARDAIEAFTRLAVSAGVRRLVLISGRGEAEAQRSEQVLAAIADGAGVEWTVVRSSFFAQNFSESILLEPVLAGEVALPVGDVRVPFVDAEDIADVVVAALTEDGHAGRVYEVTGPQSLTFAEAVAEIGRATGREIRFTQVPLETWLDALRAEQVPEDVVGLLGYLFTEVLDGRGVATADGVQQALGRPPRSFAGYARDTAAGGTWSGPVAG